MFRKVTVLQEDIKHTHIKKKKTMLVLCFHRLDDCGICTILRGIKRISSCKHDYMHKRSMFAAACLQKWPMSVTTETQVKLTRVVKSLDCAIFGCPVLVWCLWLKQEVMVGWWDIISSFIFELRPIQQTGSVLSRGLNKCLIVLHFLGTCVNYHSLIKKECINMSSSLTFPIWRVTLWL